METTAVIEDAVNRLRQCLSTVLSEKEAVLLGALVPAVMQEYETPAAMLHSVMDAVLSNQRSSKQYILDHIATKQRTFVKHVVANVIAQQPSVITQVIETAFANSDGLVSWIQDERYRREAAEMLSQLRHHLITKRGNDCRSDFDKLLAVYMDAFGVTAYSEEFGKRIMEFQAFLLPMNHGFDRKTTTLRHRLVWACNGIRNIGNDRSHTSADLSYDEQLEICAAITAFARTLPEVSESVDVDRMLASPKSSPKSSLRSVGTPPSPLLTSSTSSCSSLRSPIRTHPPPVAPQSDMDSVTMSAPAPAPLPQPPQVAYKWFYEPNAELQPFDYQTKLTFQRMLTHVKSVPKANLCSNGPRSNCSFADCGKAHTYAEVMEYNPLFKLIKCGKANHYWTREVEEPTTCVCAHVNFELSYKWMTKKKKKCADGSQCKALNCFKSHSFEEICWFNPSYKTTECDATMRCAHKDVCAYYHVESGPDCDKREVRDTDDYVGKPVKMLFQDRTHAIIAARLEHHRAAMQ